MKLKGNKRILRIEGFLLFPWKETGRRLLTRQGGRRKPSDSCPLGPLPFFLNCVEKKSIFPRREDLSQV